MSQFSVRSTHSASQSPRSLPHLPQHPTVVLRRCNCALQSTSSSQHADNVPERHLHRQALVSGLAFRTAVQISALVACSWGWAGSAQARESRHEWQPRRHHRRMGELDRRVDLGPYEVEEETVGSSTGQPGNQVLQQVEEVLGSAKSALQQGLGGNLQQGFSMSSQAPRHTRGSGRSGAVTLDGWAPVVLAAAVVGAAGLLWKRGRGRSGGRSGRWISDRSLGGKMVFIPDEPVDSPTPAKPRAFSWDDDEARELGDRGTGAAATVLPGVAPVSQPAAAAQEEIPDWWDPPPVIFVPEGAKQRARTEAKALLRELEDGKLAGRDYPLSVLVSLRTVCGEAGIGVRPATESGRDAMLRTAAEAAVSAAMGGAGAQLGSARPQRFLAGLAQDLGVPDRKAVRMAVAAVAAKARGVVIDACAALRADDNPEVLYQMLQLAGLLDKFPLPRRSAEASMIAASVQQRATLQERQKLFFMYGNMEAATADLVAEMLGFDPELVMPQLLAHIEVTKAAKTGPPTPRRSPAPAATEPAAAEQ